MKRTLVNSISILALAIATPALADSNTSTAIQTGINNDAQIDQAGSGHQSTVTQTATVNDDGNLEASVNQQGVDNDSYITQNSDATATVTQTGAANPYGTRTRDDLGYDAPSGDVLRNNLSKILQDNDAGGSTATVGQNGVLNRSSVVQTYLNNTSNVNQTGTFNNSTIYQRSYQATSTVTQGGDYGDNNSVIVQDSFSDNASATVTQYGNSTVNTLYPSNTSSIYQSADATADVTQVGQENSSQVVQTGGGAYALVQQTNDVNPSTSAAELNESIVTQSANASAWVEQVGTSNYSNVWQTADTGSVGGVYQNGYGARVQQLGDNGESRITQSGGGNDAFLFQASGTVDNNSVIEQGGNDNLAEVLQYGSDNTSTLYQSASNSTAKVTQSGDDNTSLVNQYSGSGHSAIVNQNTSGNNSNVFQSGGANAVLVNQN